MLAFSIGTLLAQKLSPRRLTCSPSEILHLLSERTARVASARGRKEQSSPNANPHPCRKTDYVAQSMVFGFEHQVFSPIDQIRNALRRPIHLFVILIQHANPSFQ